MKGRWFLSFAIGVSLLAGNSGRVEAGIFKTLRGRGRNTGVVQTVAYANPAPAYVTAANVTSVPLQVTEAVVAQVPDDRDPRGEFQRFRSDDRTLAPNFFTPRELEANIMDIQIHGRTGTYLKQRVLPSAQASAQTQ